ncbi:metallophosphoesterase family protein [Candidatus Poribacteria bacterium]|nr:metallophosphoesterase family protein [Candidatus Poribacteria bacterium]
MRVGILSDIHANLQALDAVLRDAAARDIDGWWVLGDLVGYGGEPTETIRRVAELPILACVRGNHDKVIAGIEEPTGFSVDAREAALMSRELISPESSDFLASLPKGPVAVGEGVSICHGGWHDEDAYLLRKEEIVTTFESMPDDLLFFGHTHRACVYAEWRGSIGELIPVPGEAVEIRSDARYLVNPGSVGQPRDRNPRAGYAVYDDETRKIVLLRVPYDIETAQLRIFEAQLPATSALRLAEGR